MTEAEFLEIAIRKNYSCGDHYVVYVDELVQRFSIAVDAYIIWMVKIFKPDEKHYQIHLKRALMQETTLFKAKTEEGIEEERDLMEEADFENWLNGL